MSDRDAGVTEQATSPTLDAVEQLLARVRRLRRRRLRRRAVNVGVAALALGLHLVVFLVWRENKAALSRTPASEFGAGGIALQLVRGTMGARAGSASGQSATESDTTEISPAPVQADGSGDAQPVPGAEQGGAEAAAEHTAQLGGAAGGGGAGASASSGQGYDPWAQASLAPASFSARSDSELWPRVQSCFHYDRPKAALRFAVTLDGSGNAVEVRPLPATGMARGEDLGASFLEAVKAALAACGPFRGEGRREASLVLPVG